MTLYISSFYKNIQKEFHTKDEKKSRLVRTYEYFDKARKAGDRRPSYSQKEPQIRRIQKDFNQMSVSLDTGKR